MNRILVLTVFALAVVATMTAPAFAGVGIRAGLALDPDDFIFGVHWKSSPIAENLYLVPSVEAGVGDATMIAGNLDLHYQFQTNSKLQPYAGGGLTLNWFDFDGNDDTDFGGSFLGGISIAKNMFLEAKVGLGDVPDWKFVVGWTAK